MKKITFKKKFDSLNEAITKIPESYKVNGNKFIISDGDQDIKMSWSENKPKVISMTEDMNQMKDLISFDSRKTMENTKVNENAYFNTFLETINEGYDEDYDEVPMKGTLDVVAPQGVPGEEAPQEEVPMDMNTPEQGMDPNQEQIPVDDTEVKNNAFQLVQSLIKDDPNAQELQMAINNYQGDMNTAQDTTGEFSDEMIPVDDYGQGEETNLVDEPELNPDEYSEEPFDVEMEEEIHFESVKKKRLMNI